MALIGYDPKRQGETPAPRRSGRLAAPPLEQTIMISRTDLPKVQPVRAVWLIPLVGGGLSRACIIREAETIVGRQMGADLRLWDNKVSRQHCKIVLEERGAVVVDLDSSNGTFVNEEQIERAELKDGDLLRVGNTVFRVRYMDFGDQAAADAYWLATRDPGTELYNRQYMLESLQRECARAARHDYPLTLLLAGIESQGESRETRLATLDKELRTLAAIFRQQGNEDMILGRYSTGEMAVILPMMAANDARPLAEKVQADFLATEDGTAGTRRLYFGLAGFPEQAESAEQLLERVEILLYQARTPAPPDAA